MPFFSQHVEVITVVGAEIPGRVSFRVRVTICPDHFVGERHRYFAAAAVHYVGVAISHSAVIGLFLHDHPEPELAVILFVVIGHYRPKACSYRS